MISIAGSARVLGLRRIAPALFRHYADNPDVDKLLGSVLPKDDRRALKDKLLAIEKDSYDSAMPSQTQELFAQTESLLQNISVKKDTQLPSRSFLRRETTKAIVALKREMFLKAVQDGFKEEDARILADKVVEKAAAQFHRRADSNLSALQQQKADEEAEQVEWNEKEQKIYDLAYEMLETVVFPPEANNRPGFTHRVRVEPSKSLAKIFTNTEGAYSFFDLDKLRPHTSSFWQEMEQKKADGTNMSMGPRNAFEEMIQWTEDGKMWPYPINNEYLLGAEENVHFSEHIFLDQYLKKHQHLPKTGPIAHFMELVCVGLSKNPYMDLKKKHAHLDSFAQFFNPDMIKKVDKMHEDALVTAE